MLEIQDGKTRYLIREGNVPPTWEVNEEAQRDSTVLTVTGHTVQALQQAAAVYKDTWTDTQHAGWLLSEQTASSGTRPWPHMLSTHEPWGNENEHPAFCFPYSP